MSDTIITVENLSKRYRLGQIGSTTLRESAERFWHRLRGRDPDACMASVGEYGGRGVSAYGRKGATGSPGRHSHTPTLPHSHTSSSQDLWALRDVSFEVKRGEVLGIIGRNGAGKSTLLKILTRITEPTSGRAIMRGRVASLLEVGTGFHPELTGRENVFLNGAILGMRKAEIARRFDEIIAFAEVEKFVDTPVKRYSSGMYVRLAFAVAAHLEPEILLVDEVLAVGDAAFQKKCLGKMDDVAKRGRTVLFVSHNMNAIMGLCARTMWLDNGRRAADGDTSSVVSAYLRDSHMPLGEAVFAEPQGTKDVRVRRLAVMDDQAHVSSSIRYTRPFYIAAEYEVLGPVSGLRVGVKLYNSRNIPVLHAATSDMLALGAKVGAAGIHQVKARIPGEWLAPGRYCVEAGWWSPGKGHHFHLKDGLSFDIIGATVESIGDEVLRPILEWTIE